MMRQALRMLRREWRSGELRLLVIALLLAVTASCAVGFFTDRVERALIRTTRPIAGEIPAHAASLGLIQSEQRTFRSMLLHGDAMLLTGVKAVDEHYPMKGELRLAADRSAPPRAHAGPPLAGTLWAEPRVLEQLDLKPGDLLELGASQLRLAAVLIHEPDRGGGLFSLQPRVMIHLDDLAATQLIQPGSRIFYRYLYSGSDSAVASFRDWLKPRLQPGQDLLDINDESPSISGTLSRAQRYLNLSGLLAAAMAAIAIGMAARRYTERHYDSAAMLRSFGLSRAKILRLFGLQLLLAGASAALLGVACGWLAQQGLVAIIGQMVPIALPAAGIRPALIGIATGLLILLATTLPPLLQLAAVAPLRVLRRELAPLPPASALIYGLALLVGTLLLWLYSGDLALALLIGAAGIGGALLLAGGGWLLLRLVARLPGSLAWRLALKNLLRHPRASLSQLAAFGLTLAAMALILVVRTDLLEDWRRQLPADAPNHFLINIQPWENAPLADYLAEHQIQHSGIYPMVRGRLTHINGAPAEQQLAPDAPGRRATRRELNLTWSTELAPDNRLTAGRWFLPAERGQPLISVEEKLAADLHIGLGDRLRFSFGDQTIDAEVTSLRRLDWRSLRPNFFVIFAPDALAELPSTAITSFYLAPERQRELSALLQRFPTLTVLGVEQLLDNIRRIVAQVSLAVEYVLLFVLAAGITVLFAGLSSSIDERLQEAALLRSLGARSALLRRMLQLEFLLLGGLAGLLGALLAWSASLWLYHLLEIEPRVNLTLWLATPLAGALLVGLAGHLGTRRILKQSPLSLLRNL